MNPLLASLHPYPFERLKQLFATVTPNSAYSFISLGIGEPRHATPRLVLDALAGATRRTRRIPSDGRLTRITAGMRGMGAAALWSLSRSGDANPAGEWFARSLVCVRPNRSRRRGGNPTVICPNPFYQIYEGAALLAGAKPHYAPSDPSRNFNINWDSVSNAVWADTQLVYVCSPGNPTGAVMPMSDWERLFELSRRHGFVIASDECYSEIYFREDPPLGGLEAAAKIGLTGFKNLVAFTSLSKRSNVPGMRSGFVAGDAGILKQFLLYRTYHGCAMSGMVQAASIAAWNDEAMSWPTGSCTAKNSPRSRRCCPRSSRSVYRMRGSISGPQSPAATTNASRAI
jgi:N-succinyldiaminopimelate aminotransferase